jgi:carbamoyltransferase
MNILGLNAYHADSSACLVVDGELIAAAEEERFRRVKHWAGFPAEAVRYCLDSRHLRLEDVDHVAVNRRPTAHLMKKALFVLSKSPHAAQVADRLKNSLRIAGIDETLEKNFRLKQGSLQAKVHPVEHHRAHLASAFLVSGFDTAALLSLDGFGDFASGMWGKGEKNQIRVEDTVYFPHSLGLFYLAMTQYLGFPNYGDEYKVMGLAAYGKPTELEKMRRIVLLKPRGRYELNLGYFRHHSEGVPMVWENGSPEIGTAYSSELASWLGPPRKPGEPVKARHENIAASVQAMYEEAFFHVLNHVYQITRNPRLCLAGGCALNSVANGKISKHSGFREVFIQPAAGDAGGAVGAAFYVWNQVLKKPGRFRMNHALWGPEFGEEEIGRLLEAERLRLKDGHCGIEKINDEKKLCVCAAQAVSEGKVIGWFQGRMEWGPRALGNRSVLADPRRADVQDLLNLKIKHRESFRPFASSVLREKACEWFESDRESPFMLEVHSVRAEKRGRIPGVTHVDGSSRIHTVTENQNALYYRLLTEFHRITGVPVLLNTSFNENEPMVCRPKEAIECFLRTRMDGLALGPFFISRSLEDTHP